MWEIKIVSLYFYLIISLFTIFNYSTLYPYGSSIRFYHLLLFILQILRIWLQMGKDELVFIILIFIMLMSLILILIFLAVFYFKMEVFFQINCIDFLLLFLIVKCIKKKALSKKIE